MNLLQASAIQTVAQITKVFTDNCIAIMNVDGFTVACSDPSQIGRFHPAARAMIVDRLDCFVTPESADQPDARVDLCLPILQRDLVVGAVSIVGEADTVTRLGGLLKRMAEYLLQETDPAEQEQIQESIRRRFVEQWLTRQPLADSPDFIRWGASLGIDVKAGRRVMVMEADVPDAAVDAESAKAIAARIDKTVASLAATVPNAVVSRLQSRLVCCLSLHSNSALGAFAANMQQYVHAKFGRILRIGIDEKTDDISSAYKKAQKALECACRSSRKNIVFYDEIDMDIFIHELSNDVKQQYIEKIYQCCTNEEITESLTILDAYLKHNGSIQNVASELFMHKNTVQYKIKKIAFITGYDMRNMKDAAVLYLGSLFYNSRNR